MEVHTGAPSFWAGRWSSIALYLFVMRLELAAMTKISRRRSRAIRLFLPWRKGQRRADRVHRKSSRGERTFWRDWPRSHEWRLPGDDQADKDCDFCDYRGICGDVEAVAAASVRKLQGAHERDPGTLRRAATNGERLSNDWTPVAVDKPPPDQLRGSDHGRLDKNLLVEAAAGTGKTTSLVARMINFIRHSRVDELAAVTFTRKAASELRSRFQAGLEQAPRGDGVRERTTG